MAEGESFGLGGLPESEWPRVSSSRRPIDILRPRSPEHDRVLHYLLKRIDASERTMTRFHPRWNIAERKIQTYISLPDREQALREISDSGRMPQARPIVVPYMMATVATIVTYLVNVFLGRKPYFPIGTRGDNVSAALLMEQVLQYQADHNKLAYHLFRYFLDGEIYGVQVLKCFWDEVFAPRTVWRSAPQLGFMGNILGSQRVAQREMRLTYQGNKIESVDPYLFFPDPCVPMAEVARKGEFVCVRSFQGYHALKNLEANGDLKYVDEAPRKKPQTGPFGSLGSDDSLRHLLSGGDALLGSWTQDLAVPSNTYQVDQGSFEIIPRELGIGESELPQKYIFTILNKAQIAQAEPWEADHGMHPVVCGEPYSFGYGFGQPAITDWIGPIQDSVSWFLNSHMQNVREAINNIFIYNPNYVEEQDFKNPGPGMRIRLKETAIGQDIDKIIQQFPVADMTRGHVNDLELFIRIGDSLSAVNENLRGQPHQGGRKTATEVMASAESGSSRLASHAKFISAQSITDLTEQMSLNTQQWLSEDMYLQIVGPAGIATPIHIQPEMLVGDFYYPPHDGTLPTARGALFDIWRELFQVVLQDQEFRMTYDVTKIFEHIAELGGARNVQQFRRQMQAPGMMPGQMPMPGMGAQMMPDEQVAQQMQQGNVVPMRDFA